MKTLMLSLLLLSTFTLKAQHADAPAVHSAMAAPVAVQQAVGLDFPGEVVSHFATLAETEMVIATIKRRKSVMLAAYSPEGLLISTTERMPIAYLPVAVAQRVRGAFPDYTVGRTFEEFRTIVDGEGILNYRVHVSLGDTTYLVIIDDEGNIDASALSSFASL